MCGCSFGVDKGFLDIHGAGNIFLCCVVEFFSVLLHNFGCFVNVRGLCVHNGLNPDLLVMCIIGVSIRLF